MEKPKIPIEEARTKAERIIKTLEPFCERIQIAGSIRRNKPLVGDIEILYIPKNGILHLDGDLMPTAVEDLCKEKVKSLIQEGTLQLRKKSDGTTAFGEKVKLLRISGCNTPLDIFRCSPENWWNNLFSRTGGKENNILIASNALQLGLEWLPFGPGFLVTNSQELIPVTSEEDVYRITKLPFEPPENRR